MKPKKYELVHGTDQNGNQFPEGIVTETTRHDAEIMLPDGSLTYAEHKDIKNIRGTNTN